MEQPVFKTFRLIMAGIIICFVCLFSLQSIVNEKILVKEMPLAKSGQLDLSQWDDARYIKTLGGQWAFYWNSLSPVEVGEKIYANVPSTWEAYDFIDRPEIGVASYQLNVTGLRPNQIYALKTLDQVTAFELYGNGKLIAANGTVGKHAEDTVPKWQPIRTQFVSDDMGKVVFNMTVANFDYNRGGFWNNLIIGQPALVNEYATARILSEMFLFSSLFIMAAFFFGMHFLYSKEKDTLLFALFCVMTSLQIGLTGERVLYYFVNQLSWYTLVRIEYWSGYMLLPFFGLYLVSRFPKDAHKLVGYGFGVSGMVMTLICWVLPIPVLAASLAYYKYLCLMTAPYFLWLMSRIVLNGRQGAVWMLLAFITMLLSVIKDTFYMSEYSALPYGAFVFLIAFALLTITKYVGVQKTNVLLESRAMRDPLTGVYNRSYLEAFQEFGINTPYFVIFLDLDRFKQINDQFGHDIGDQVLVEITRRLRRLCRPADVICRYGGDEFVMLIMDDGFIDIKSFIKQLKQVVKEPVYLKDIEAIVGVSVGLSHFPTAGYTLSDLIRHSDLAMYRDKLSENEEQ